MAIIIFQPEMPAEYFYIIRDGQVNVQDFEIENIPLELNVKDSFGGEAITYRVFFFCIVSIKLSH